MSDFRKHLSLCLICLLAFSLTGCNLAKEEDLNKLDEKISSLQKEIEVLEAAKEEKNTEAVNASDAVSKQVSSIDGLKDTVSRMEETIEETIPAGTEEERMNQYFDLKNEIKQLSANIDAYDDNLEIRYKNNSLDYTDYRIEERAAGDLKDRLEKAKEALKQLFRIDDTKDGQEEAIK